MRTGIWLLLVLSALSAKAADWPVFICDRGTQSLAPKAKAELIKKCGFARLGNSSSSALEYYVEAYDQAGVELVSIHTVVGLQNQQAHFQAGLFDEIKKLKDRKTMICLGVQGIPGEEPENKLAVPAVRRVCDAADEVGLKLVLYPGRGGLIGSVENALRIAKKSKRDNVGVAFNQVVFLEPQPKTDPTRAIRSAGDQLWLVTLCGADMTRKVPSERPRPIYEGKYNHNRLFKVLKDVNYEGPIGLDCFQVEGDVSEYMQKSLATWNGLMNISAKRR